MPTPGRHRSDEQMLKRKKVWSVPPEGHGPSRQLCVYGADYVHDLRTSRPDNYLNLV